MVHHACSGCFSLQTEGDRPRFQLRSKRIDTIKCHQTAKQPNSLQPKTTTNMTPNTEQQATWLDDPDLFMAMDDLELVAHGLVEGALNGLHRSPYLGFSVEFDAHRKYEPGDDLRHVNWNLWARTDRLYVKQFKSDTNLDLYLLLDSSASMLCANGPSPKWQYGARAAAALAYLSLHCRDAAGLTLLAGNVVDHVSPRLRAGQFQALTAMLGETKPSGESNFSQAMEEALHLCRRRGIVVLISDLFDDEQRILRGLSDFRHYGHEVIVVNVLDAWEHKLPEQGQFEFRDLETNDTLRASSPMIRNAAYEQIVKWRRSLARRCAQTGIEWLECTTEDPLRNILIDYLMKRAGTG